MMARRLKPMSQRGAPPAASTILERSRPLMLDERPPVQASGKRAAFIQASLYIHPSINLSISIYLSIYVSISIYLYMFIYMYSPLMLNERPSVRERQTRRLHPGKFIDIDK